MPPERAWTRTEASVSPDRRAQKTAAAKRSRARDQCSINAARETFPELLYRWLVACSAVELLKVGRLAFVCLQRSQFFAEATDAAATAPFGWTLSEWTLSEWFKDPMTVARPLRIDDEPPALDGQQSTPSLSSASFLHFLRLVCDPRVHRADGASTSKRNFEFGGVVNDGKSSSDVQDAVTYAVHIVKNVAVQTCLGILPPLGHVFYVDDIRVIERKANRRAATPALPLAGDAPTHLPAQSCYVTPAVPLRVELQGLPVGCAGEEDPMEDMVDTEFAAMQDTRPLVDGESPTEADKTGNMPTGSLELWSTDVGVMDTSQHEDPHRPLSFEQVRKELALGNDDGRSAWRLNV